MQGSELTGEVIGSAIDVHRELGPGKREPAYEKAVAHEFSLRGLVYEVQRKVPVCYKGVIVECGYRLDVLVRDSLVLEIKAVETVHPLHRAQVLTYLKLGGWRLALLLNFHVAALKDGIERLVLGFDNEHEAGPTAGQTQKVVGFSGWKVSCGDSAADVLAKEVIQAAAEVHHELGPGLLASAYQTCLCYEFQLRRIPFQRRFLPLKYKGFALGETDEIELLVGDCLVVKPTAKHGVHALEKAELLSQLRLGGWPAGLLINFNTMNLCDGLTRVVFTQPN